ncbi:MAG: hypothetical protein JO193_01595 [Candidatus Eremiobacteraeota bacterium]|nr:hypothetical protein [Candidatus Eremiobacteraeota bacterium]
MDPWVQWPTVHSGVPYEMHGVAHMGDGGIDLQYPGIAQLLSSAGVRVGVFGSMNLNYGHLNGYMIPDPWDRRQKTHPAWLAPFYRVVSQQVKDSSRYAITGKQIVDLGTFLATHGLTASTALACAKQLLDERRDSGLRWRRAMLLDYIAYDVFRSLNKRFNVEFATFFSNSTAHYQHFYWRDMEPEAFQDARPSSHPSLQNAILDGYKSMDALLARFMQDYPNATLILCTAISQGPRREVMLHDFHITDFNRLLDFVRLPRNRYRVAPMMSSEFHLISVTADEAMAAEHSFQSLTLEGTPAFHVKREANKVVLSIRSRTEGKALDKRLSHPDGESVRFGDVAHMLEGSSSGVHGRTGALWIKTGRHRTVGDHVKLTDVAPTILQLFDVPTPAHMDGRSLISGAVAQTSKDGSVRNRQRCLETESVLAKID